MSTTLELRLAQDDTEVLAVTVSAADPAAVDAVLATVTEQRENMRRRAAFAQRDLARDDANPALPPGEATPTEEVEPVAVYTDEELDQEELVVPIAVYTDEELDHGL